MVNNQTFIRQVAKKTGYTIGDIEAVVKAIPDVIVENLVAGEDVKAFSGITFKTEIKEAHEGRNPKTGAPIEIPAKRAVKATFTDSFKASLN